MSDVVSDTAAETAPVVDASSVRPTPTDEEMAAIMASVEVAWPRPVVLVDETPEPSRWRFSGRWWSKPVPSRRRRS